MVVAYATPSWNSPPGMGRDGEEPRATERRLTADGRVMAATTAHTMPTQSSTSPMLTTSRRMGMGMGTTSPKIPPEVTNWPAVRAVRTTWNGSPTRSARVRPAANRAPSQTGIFPSFRRTARMFMLTPTAATWSPGTFQLRYSQTTIRP